MASKYFVDSDSVVLKVVKSRFGQDRILFLRFGENIMASELVICRVNPERRFWPRPVVILQYFYRPVAAYLVYSDMETGVFFRISRPTCKYKGSHGSFRFSRRSKIHPMTISLSLLHNRRSSSTSFTKSREQVEQLETSRHIMAVKIDFLIVNGYYFCLMFHLP